MADGTPWIGTRMLPSWSLRGWLAVQLAGPDVEEVVIGLDQPGAAERIRARVGHGGPYLFGAAFTLADAMFAPVRTRFTTWRPDLAADAWAYVEAVQAHPLMRRRFAEAAAEPASWKTPKYFTVPT